MLTSFSPKTDETDGMMDRPEENQTNSQRLLARRPPSPRRLVELSEGTAAGGGGSKKGFACILHIPSDGWMTDYTHQR